MRNILKDAQVKSATSRNKPIRLSDGEGLCLLVNKITKEGKQGSKSWQYRYRFNGNSRIFTIGKYPSITLKDARERHLAAEQLVSDSVCPCENKKIQKLKQERELKALKRANKIAIEHSFEAVAREWYKDTRHEWKNEKHIAAVLTTLEVYVFPLIGSKHVAEVTKANVWEVIRVLKDKGIYETASKVLQRISAVFDYAIIVMGLMEHNPTVGVSKFIKRPADKRDRHYPALEGKEMPQFLEDYEKTKLKPQTRIATKLLMLTAVRTSELIEARWSEFDFEEKQWVIPAARMKMARDHVVPLSRQTIEALEKARLYSRNSKLVFPGRSSNKKPISNNTILFSIYKTSDYRGRMTGHGFRSVFSTYLHGLKNKKEQRVFQSDAIERQLAHVEGNKVKAAYDRNKHLKERTRLMQTWADTCDNWAGKSDNVVPIHRTA